MGAPVSAAIRHNTVTALFVDAAAAVGVGHTGRRRFLSTAVAVGRQIEAAG